MPGVYTVYGVTMTPGMIDQIVDCQWTPAVSQMLLSGDGAVDDLFAAGLTGDPIISFTTTAVNTALGYVGLNGYNEQTGITVFWQEVANKGIRAGTTSHIKMTIASALILPRTLQAAQDDVGGATITYDIIPLSSNGSAAPVTIDLDQTLTGTPTVDEAYTLGAVTLNNTALTYVQSITMNFGIAETMIRSSGNPYPIFAGIMRRRPTIVVRTNDMEWIDTFDLLGVAKSAATTIQLQAVTQGAVPAGTYLTLTVNEGRFTINQAGGGNEAPAVAEILVTPTYDGSNAVVVIS